MKQRLLFCDDSHTFGGAQKALRKLVDYFVNDGYFDIYVAISFNNKELLNEFVAMENIKLIDGYQVTKMPSITSYFDNKQYQIAYEVIKNVNPTFAIVNLAGIEFGINYSRVLKRCGIKYIAWLHNSTSFTDMLRESSFKIKLLASLRDFIAKSFLVNFHNNLVVVSLSSHDEMYRRGTNQENLFTIENPIPKINIPLTSKKNHYYKVGIFGRIQFCHKGQDQIIKVVTKYEKNLQNMKFHFYGDGPDMEILKLSSKNDLIVAEGWTNSVTQEMQGCDLILMPSRFEGLSLVLLEALALKKQILSSDIDAFYLVHEKDKYKLDDIDDLYEKLTKKIDNINDFSMYYDAIRLNLSEEAWFEKFKNRLLRLGND
ncbi:MAG: glycosyltransferase [Sulfuricurvum sp.]|nr:glycosyltransferase [Sulfuricurvum sp.]